MVDKVENRPEILCCAREGEKEDEQITCLKGWLRREIGARSQRVGRVKHSSNADKQKVPSVDRPGGRRSLQNGAHQQFIMCVITTVVRIKSEMLVFRR